MKSGAGTWISSVVYQLIIFDSLHQILINHKNDVRLITMKSTNGLSLPKPASSAPEVPSRRSTSRAGPLVYHAWNIHETWRKTWGKSNNRRDSLHQLWRHATANGSKKSSNAWRSLFEPGLPERFICGTCNNYGYLSPEAGEPQDVGGQRLAETNKKKMQVRWKPVEAREQASKDQEI